MNNQEAKFILGAYRPDGRDATDAMYAEALAQAERDPELREWLRRQRAFDGAVAARLAEIMPPAELKQSILAGARASRPRPQWWVSPVWLAVAAAIVVAAATGVSLLRSTGRSGVAEFLAVAQHDIVSAYGEHAGYPSGLSEVQARLASARQPLLADAGLDLAELKRHNCRSVHVAGREVFELCFQRDGAWFHLYVARREDYPSGDNASAKALVASTSGHASAAWSDAKNVYALITTAGEAALRRLI